MELKQAYCGLSCETCLIRVASCEQDKTRQKTMRKEIAQQISKFYGVNQPLDSINDCDGCRAKTGRLFSGCKKCAIRTCALNMNVESCAYCENYPCEILNNHFILDPDAKVILDNLRPPN